MTTSSNLQHPTPNKTSGLSMEPSAQIFQERLESLPRELYDAIFELTFTTDTKLRVLPKCAWYYGVKHDASTRPSISGSARNFFPPLLHVSRATRAMFAASHYGLKSPLIFHEVHTLMRWIESLPKEHLEMMRQIKWRRPGPSTASEVEKEQGAAYRLISPFLPEVDGRLEIEFYNRGELAFDP